MNRHEPQLIVADGPDADKRLRWARRLSRLMGPLPATVAATVLASVVARPSDPWPTLGLVVGLFGGTAVVAIAALRLTGGPGSVTRRRAVPWVLGVEVVALALGSLVGIPVAVVAAFVAFFVVGVVALIGANANVSAHGLMAGALVGLSLGWSPLLGAVGLVLLAALVCARVVLRQHTVVEAVTGAAIGVGVGLVAALVVG